MPAPGFAEQIQGSCLAAVRSDLDHLALVEDEPADAVARIQCPPGAQSGDFRGSDRLHRPTTAEEHGGSLIDQQQHRSLPFLVVDANLR
jgi:hypothetical protein